MQPRAVISIANFFLSLLTTLGMYIMLPYLSTLMPTSYTGLVIAGGGLAALLFFPCMPRLIARHGAQPLIVLFALTEILALFLLAAAPGVIASVFFVIVMVALQPFLSYGLDLLLEAAGAEEGSTGRVRAVFLTAWNMGTFVAPLLIGTLLADSTNYGRVFIAAAVGLIPFVILFVVRRLPRGEVREPSALFSTLRCILHDRDLTAVTFGHLVLWLFYVWAPLYVPVYLHNVLNIPWSTLGWLFSIMLIPYVVIEYPAGWIADRFIGDKEMMLAGFLAAGGALASLSLLTPTSSIPVILGILLLSRSGAALVESMTEGHFFRRVSERDINSVSIFRGVWPLAFVIGPVAGSVILFFGNYQLLFLLTGGFVLVAGGIATLFIKDFR